MSTRKISSCINVRINLGNFQHVDITKYCEEEIEFTSEAERVQKEDSLEKDTLNYLVRGINKIPERLNKGAVEIAAFEEHVKAGIPAWLANNPIPNIANKAKKIEGVIKAEAKQNLDKVNSYVDPVATVTPVPEVSTKSVDVVAPVILKEKAVTEVTEVRSGPKSDLFDTLESGATKELPVVPFVSVDSTVKVEPAKPVSAIVPEVKAVKEAKKDDVDDWF